jgi:DNA-binding transcriptional LysR family regulator
MKFRHLEYFVAAAEELNFTHAADRLHVSQPPFSKQIHDLEGELGIEFFERHRKGVALTPAGKSFLIDARRILEDCGASIRRAQRISRGEIGELAIGYISALTHGFLGKALEVWRLTSPEIIVDCIEMDSVTQEKALLEGRISVGILVPSDRPVLELLRFRFLIKYPVSLALPKSHPHANKQEIPLSLLKEEPFIGLNRMYPNYGDWLLKVCRRVGFKPRSGRRRKRARLRSGGFWSGSGQRAAAEDTCQGCDFPRSGARGQRVGASGRCLEAGCSIRSSRLSICRHPGSSLCRRQRGESCPANGRLN